MEMFTVPLGFIITRDCNKYNDNEDRGIVSDIFGSVSISGISFYACVSFAVTWVESENNNKEKI